MMKNADHNYFGRLPSQSLYPVIKDIKGELDALHAKIKHLEEEVEKLKKNYEEAKE